MNIGIDCRLWNETGVGRYIRNLVFELQKANLAHTFVLFSLSKDSEKIRQSVNAINFSVVVADIRWHSLEEQFLFPQILRNERLDLMHFPYFSVPIFYTKPFVVTIHDLIIDHYPTGEATTHTTWYYWLKVFAYKYIVQQATRNAVAIIAVSHATKQEIIDHLHIPDKKIFVTYEGRNETKKDIQNISFKKKYFLHVGNVYPHKNVVRLLEAFSRFVAKHPEFQIVFVGKKDMFFDRLQEKVIAEKLSDSVVLTGLVSDDVLNAYYQHACAVVIPSLMEGFGLPAIEAMDRKCLVLASDIPSLREICVDSAIYFDPLKVQDIANMMEKAVQLPIAQRRKLIQKAADHVLSYSWTVMTRETIRIYEGCIGIR